MVDLVSIIMPAYNAEEYIGESIESVINQSYKNWELIIVDDCSTDQTSKIIQKYKRNDNRIKYIKMSINSGAAKSRNEGIRLSKGVYIAFLDSDDLWKENKLLHQIHYMNRNDVLFCCTYYDQINEQSLPLNKIVTYKSKAKYDTLLRNCPGNSTVIYNSRKLGKIYAKNLKRRNDYVLWLDVIKKSHSLYCLDEILSSYRVRKDSISSNKLKLIKYHWHIYYRIEKLGFFKSCYLTFYWCYKGIKKFKI